MSHFVLAAIIPKHKADDYENHVKALLAPFDDKIDVEPYQRKCYCIGYLARFESRKKADELYDIDSLHRKYLNAPENRRPEIEKSFNVMKKAWKQAYKEVFDSHPLKDKPDPECEECKGTGTYESTYNPKSKWHWYEIGGRWDGWVTDKPGDNVVEVQQFLDSGLIPFAILTPDGEWHEEGEMGWFGISTNNKENWDDIARSIFEKYKDGHLAVIVDCHI